MNFFNSYITCLNYLNIVSKTINLTLRGTELREKDLLQF